jgi:hypothetical protein
MMQNASQSNDEKIYPYFWDRIINFGELLKKKRKN